jgi:hypothetical protein
MMKMLSRLAAAGVAAVLGWGAAAEGGYTVNGAEIAPEMAALLAHYGFEPGAYYIDQNGNYGRSGSAPSGNFHGGPARGWSGVEPTGVGSNPYALAYVNGVTGVRVFWVYSPSIFSDVKGGSSGYVHICPGNVYHSSHEGAVNVGGDYDVGTGQNDSWAGVAGQSAATGRWTIENGPQGPTLALYGPDGGSQSVPVATMMQGSWTFNRTKYAAEAGKASC